MKTYEVPKVRDIEAVLCSMKHRCSIAKAMGGISAVSVANGKKIPTGWVLDTQTDYWVPASFK